MQQKSAGLVTVKGIARDGQGATRGARRARQVATADRCPGPLGRKPPPVYVRYSGRADSLSACSLQSRDQRLYAQRISHGSDPRPVRWRM